MPTPLTVPEVPYIQPLQNSVPKDHPHDGFGGPNSIIVVYMSPLGVLTKAWLRFSAAGLHAGSFWVYKVFRQRVPGPAFNWGGGFTAITAFL